MKASSFIISILIVIILSMLGGGYYLYIENNKILKQNKSDISDLKQEKEDITEEKRKALQKKDEKLSDLRKELSNEKDNNYNYSLEISNLKDDIKMLESQKTNKNNPLVITDTQKIIDSQKDTIKKLNEENRKLKAKIVENKDNTEKSSNLVKNSKYSKTLNYTTPKLQIGSDKLSNRDLLIFGSQIKGALSKIKKGQYILIESNTDDLKFIGDIENRKNINLAFKRIIKNILNLSETEINNLQFKINTKSNDRTIKIYTVTL